MYITRSLSLSVSVIQLPLLETLKMEESQKSDKPKAHKRQKTQKKKQDCVQIVNIDKKKPLDSNANEKKTPIVFQIKFGAPFCIILLLIFFIQRLSMILT